MNGKPSNLWLFVELFSITGHHFYLFVLKGSSMQIFFKGSSICTTGCPVSDDCIAKSPRLHWLGYIDQQIPIARSALTFWYFVVLAFILVWTAWLLFSLQLLVSDNVWLRRGKSLLCSILQDGWMTWSDCWCLFGISMRRKRPTQALLLLTTL